MTNVSFDYLQCNYKIEKNCSKIYTNYFLNCLIFVSFVSIYFLGGTVLAWGNNSRAQLGRIPARETRDADDKLVLLKSSKRLVRLPNALHVALDVPSQVPGISAPIISYRSNDVFSLSGLIRPLSVIEKTSGELTLDYVLEHFYGLYNSADVMEKVCYSYYIMFNRSCIIF